MTTGDGAETMMQRRIQYPREAFGLPFFRCAKTFRRLCLPKDIDNIRVSRIAIGIAIARRVCRSSARDKIILVDFGARYHKRIRRGNPCAGGIGKQSVHATGHWQALPVHHPQEKSVTIRIRCAFFQSVIRKHDARELSVRLALSLPYFLDTPLPGGRHEFRIGPIPLPEPEHVGINRVRHDNDCITPKEAGKNPLRKNGPVSGAGFPFSF